jgi:transcriptional regulator of arginine metabolism
MRKSERHNLIMDLVAGGGVTRQAQILDALRQQGLEVTQASVSRDLDELGIEKTNGRYARTLNENSRMFRVLLEITRAGENLLVAKSPAGLASAVAVQIDEARIPEIIGTIAGDDTIFIAVGDAQQAEKAEMAITEIFERGKVNE